MKNNKSWPDWWRTAYQQGLVNHDAPPKAPESPSILVVAMAMLGTLVCLIPIFFFVVLTLGEDALVGITGIVLGVLSLLSGLAMLRNKQHNPNSALQDCVGLVLWGVGSGLLLLNSGVEHLESRADWVGLCALSMLFCVLGGWIAQARWIQMLMGWGLGATLYVLLLLTLGSISWLLPLQGIELTLLVAWWLWLVNEPQRLSQTTRWWSQARWAVVIDAAVVAALCATVLLTDPRLMLLSLFDAQWQQTWDWAFTASRWVAVGMVLIATVWLLYAWHTRKSIDRSTIYMLLLIAGVLMVCAWFYPRVGTVALFASVALAAARWRIAILCAVISVGLLSQFYYNITWTLTAKGVGMAIIGIVLLAGAILIPWFTAQQTPVSTAANRQPLSLASIRRDKVWLLVGMVLALVLVNWDVYRKEQVITHGQRILVPLVPVDPRSLMQGDYMALRFDIPSKALQELEQSAASTRYIRAKLDNKGVASLGTLTEIPVALEADEVVLPLKRLKGQWVLVTDAYFFPEGQGERFESAKYGDFRVLSEGRALLIGLASRDGEIIPASP